VTLPLLPVSLISHHGFRATVRKRDPLADLCMEDEIIGRTRLDGEGVSKDRVCRAPQVQRLGPRIRVRTRRAALYRVTRCVNMHLTEVEGSRQCISEAEQKSGRKLGVPGAHFGRLHDIVAACADQEDTADSTRRLQLVQVSASDLVIPAPAVAGVDVKGGRERFAVEVAGRRRPARLADVAKCRADVARLKAGVEVLGR